MSAKVHSHIYGLDGLRAVAIFMIFVVHAWGHSGKPEMTIEIANLGMVEVHTAMLWGAGVGLEIFFIASSFLLSLSFWRRVRTNPGDNFSISYKDYLTRRVFRIYPAYLVAIIVYALFHDVAHSLSVRAIHFGTHALLVHNLFEATISNLSEPLWFVATQFQLYLILPFVLLFIWRLGKRGLSGPLAALAVFVLGGLGGIVFFQAAVFLLNQINLDPRIVAVDGTVLMRSPFRYLAGFSAGILCSCLFVYFENKVGRESRFYSAISEGGKAILALILLIVAIAVGRFSGPYPSYWPGFQLLAGSLLLVVILSSPRFGIARLLEFRPIRFLGVISFSFYLYHDIVLSNVYSHAGSLLGNSALNTNVFKGLVAFLLTAGVAWVSHELVEKRLTTYIVDGRKIQQRVKQGT
jgi:peptidoglycan/LPS O-acetylase OafA/YrhL